MKVLIICNFFPPVNRTGAHRPYHLARCLLDRGMEVTVLTGEAGAQDTWNAPLGNIRIIRLPLTRSPYDLDVLQKIIARAYWSARRPLLKRVMQVIADLFLPVNMQQRFEFHPQSVEAHTGVQDVVIATGPSWSMFEYGHVLSRRWNSTFMVDYRDPWSVRLPEVALRLMTWQGAGLIGYLRKGKMQDRELTLTREAHAVTAATPTVLTNALAVIGERPALTVLNGVTMLQPPEMKEAKNKLTIVYTGQVYEEQEWEIVEEALLLLARERDEGRGNIELLLVGVASIHDPTMELLEALARQTTMVRLVERLGREQVMAIQRSADLLLHVGFKDKKGILPIKFLEYLGSGVPIVQVSTGEDLQEELIRRTRTGIVVRTAPELRDHILRSLAQVQKGAPAEAGAGRDEMELARHSWDVQMSKWVGFMDRVHSQRKSPE